MSAKQDISLYEPDDVSDIEYNGVRDDAEVKGSLLEATEKNKKWKSCQWKKQTTKNNAKHVLCKIKQGWLNWISSKHPMRGNAQ